MKHLKKFKIFESITLTDPELIEVRDVFIEFAQDHDLEFVENVWLDTQNMSSGGGGVYSLRKLNNTPGIKSREVFGDYTILIEIFLPFEKYRPTKKKSRSVDKYIYINDLQEYANRFYRMGYENVKVLYNDSDDILIQVAM